MQLNLTNISYTYPGAVSPAVRDVGVTFSSGWTAVIGDNGCGKSTLARIATRLIEPDSGTVGSKLFSVYCQQDSSLEPGNLIDFASDWNQEAQRAKALLHIGDDWPWRYDTLSGGQQKRSRSHARSMLAPTCLSWMSRRTILMPRRVKS